ncbi:DNA polymerase III subunit delta [Deferribacter abyssi]|uniref:DNA polymerase III subunit delta n=1 Tax=Deferribacter abyssi TaxID=213806 RepID=UPI003C228BD1
MTLKKKILIIGSHQFNENKLKELIIKNDNIDIRKYNDENFNLEEISDYLFTYPLFGENKHLIIKNAHKIKDILSNSELFKSPCEAHIIFLAEENNELLKTFKNSFEIIKEKKLNYKDNISEIIFKFKERDLPISFNEAKEIYELCQRNMEIFNQELEKISLYFYNKKPKSFEEILNIISSSNVNNVFAFIESFYSKNWKKALAKLNLMIENHENLQMAFYMLTKRGLEILYYLISPDLVTGQTFKIAQIKSASEKWSKKELFNLIEKFYQIDKKLKTSTVKMEYELTSLIDI